MAAKPPADPNKKGSNEPVDPPEKEEDTAVGTTGPAAKSSAAPQPPSKPPPDSKSTAAKKKRALWDTFIKNLSNEEYTNRGEKFNFKYHDLIHVLISIKATLMADPSLVRCNLPCVIIGDIHGQYVDLFRIFSLLAQGNKPGWLVHRFVFLGDYIDRGPRSLEVIVCLCLPTQDPLPQAVQRSSNTSAQIFLLRGNHECKQINRVYGFLMEMESRFGKEKGNDLFHMFNEAFTHLPFACLVGANVLCMHGGISDKLTSLEAIEQIPKPLVDPNTNQLACDLLWADPMLGLNGYMENSVRGVSVHFGEDVLHSTMDRLNLHMIVRGHQMMMNGFNFFGNPLSKKKLVTVFTAPSYYPDRPNRGAAMVVRGDGLIGFKIVDPISEDEATFRRNHDSDNVYDCGYKSYVADEKGGKKL